MVATGPLFVRAICGGQKDCVASLTDPTVVSVLLSLHWSGADRFLFSGATLGLLPQRFQGYTAELPQSSDNVPSTP